MNATISWYERPYMGMLYNYKDIILVPSNLCVLLTLLVWVIVELVRAEMKNMAFIKEQARLAALEKARKKAAEAEWKAKTPVEKTASVAWTIVGYGCLAVLAAPAAVLVLAAGGNERCQATVDRTLDRLDPVLTSKKKK